MVIKESEAGDGGRRTEKGSSCGEMPDEEN